MTSYREVAKNSDVFSLKEIYERHNNESFDLMIRAIYEKGGQAALNNFFVYIVKFMEDVNGTR